jgi:16S rRNA (guanine527-N7)-methyltransferase
VIGAGENRELSLLCEGCSELGVSLSSEQLDRLLRYVDLVYVWNKAAGLTTIPREKAIRLHVLDSLAALRAIDRGPCLDLGTGAGLPGLVLAIACPDTEFVLGESNRRRCSFLLEVVRVLGLRNVRVVEGDVDALPADQRYPLVISRAFRPPPEFLSTASRLVDREGRVVLLMADPSDGDLLMLAQGAELVLDRSFRLTLPGGTESRTIAVLRRV